MEAVMSETNLSVRAALALVEGLNLAGTGEPAKGYGPSAGAQAPAPGMFSAKMPHTAP
jgi:hypothetical protein